MENIEEPIDPCSTEYILMMIDIEISDMTDCQKRYSNPELLLQMPEYKQRPDDRWLNTFLCDLLDIGHLFVIATHIGLDVSHYQDIFTHALQTAREGVEQHT
ncbi:MAG TPA: hypothetical protein VHV83_10385, partial [Armatimonadota bacterium]|nr:hypothetical protein [Armatimonadota bacterium]